MNTRRITLWALLSLAGCDPDYSAQPFDLGKDACDVCRMTIVDGRYGGEVFTPQGKVKKFDTAECLASYLKTMRTNSGASYFARFDAPGKFVSTNEAILVHSPSRSGPMGSTMIAFPTLEDARRTLQDPSPAVADWKELTNTP